MKTFGFVILTSWRGEGMSKERDFYDFCDYLRFSLFGGSAFTEWKKLEVDWKVFLPPT